MVQPESQRIVLEVTVDKAELERQFGDVFGGAGAPKGEAQGKQRLSYLSPDEKNQLTGFRQEKKARAEQAELAGFLKPTAGEAGKGAPVNPGQGFVKYLKALPALFGIGLGITALVRNSKLLGETSKAFNSILGAMVDVFIAPFMPAIAKGLTKLASWIPNIAQFGADVRDSVNLLIRAFRGDVKAIIDVITGGGIPGFKKKVTESLAKAKGDQSWLEFSGFAPNRKGLFGGIPGVDSGPSGSKTPGPDNVVIQITQVISTATESTVDALGEATEWLDSAIRKSAGDITDYVRFR